jgi:hypothetical protein
MSADVNMRESSIEIPLEPSLVANLREIEKQNNRESSQINSKPREPESTKVTAEQLLKDDSEGEQNEEEPDLNSKLFYQHIPVIGKTPMCK